MTATCCFTIFIERSWGFSLIHLDSKYLNFNDDVSKCHILSNLIMSPSVKVNLGGVRYMSYYSDGVAFSNQQVARSFFTRVSRVKDLVISETIMKVCFNVYSAYFNDLLLTLLLFFVNS